MGKTMSMGNTNTEQIGLMGHFLLILAITTPSGRAAISHRWWRSPWSVDHLHWDVLKGGSTVPIGGTKILMNFVLITRWNDFLSNTWGSFYFFSFGFCLFVFTFWNVATRKFTLPYVATILFFLDGDALRQCLSLGEMNSWADSAPWWLSV